MRYFLCVMLFLASPLVTAAGWSVNWENDFDDEKPWVELQAKIPPYPVMEEALPFFVSAATDNQFFIDPKSISVGADNVVRYTLLVKSSEGALNVSYEGMRCGTEEFKLYAFGHSDKTWSRNRYAKWSRIEYKDRNRQHHMLYDDFFCPNGIIVKDDKEAISALKRGINPRAEQ